jgi:hypothetical protein
MAKYEGEVLFEQPKAAPVGSSSPNIVPIADGRDTTAKYDAEAKAEQDKLMAKAEKDRLESATSSPFQWQGILNSPTALVTGAGVIATLGGAAGYGLRGRLLSRKGATPAIDIPTEASPASMYTAAEQELLNLSERNRLANAANAAAKANPLPQGMTPGVPTGQPNVNANPAGAFAQQPNYSAAPPAAPQSQFDPTRIGQPLQDPLANRGYQTPPQEIGPRQPIAPSVAETVATGGNVGQAVKQTVANELDAVPPPQELRTGTGKPAFAGQGPEPTISSRTNKPQFKDVYKDVSQVPTGYAFVPNAQYIDIPRQDLGQAEYTKAYSGRDFPATNEIAREQSKEINRTLGRATREEAKLAGLPPAEVTPGITKMTTAGKKRVTVGGALGALVALPELANAASEAGQGNVAPARELGFDFGTSAMLAKLFGGPAAAAGALALGSTSLNPNEQQQLDYLRKVGGGRGIAPPSAYKR